jgi:hypothetical protein
MAVLSEFHWIVRSNHSHNRKKITEELPRDYHYSGFRSRARHNTLAKSQIIQQTLGVKTQLYYITDDGNS